MHSFIFRKTLSFIVLVFVFSNQGISDIHGRQTLVPFYDSSRFCTPSPSGAIFWLTADSTTQDLVGNNHGTAYNNLMFDTGKVGLAFNFDGIDDYIVVEDSGRLILGASDFTIEGWIFPTAYNGAGGWNAIIARHNNDNGSWLLRIAKNGFTGDVAKLNMEIDFPVQRYFGNSEITLNEWHHIAVTRSGSDCTFYLEGNYDGGFTNSDLLNSTSPLMVSGQVNSGSERFTGKIDELAIYNRALTQEELRSIILAGEAGKCKPNTGNINGVVFIDANWDGVHQSEETTLANLNMYLYSLSQETPLDSTMTDENGMYVFSSIETGEYMVKLQTQVGWEGTTTLAETVNVDDGVIISKLDFGIIYSLDCKMVTGWNLLSVPLIPFDITKIVLFPTAISNAFEYSGSYNTRDTLHRGKGYWVKFSSSENIPVKGVPIATDTIEVNQGWNLIGSITDSVEVNSILTLPDHIIASQFFGYKAGYNSVSSILPGQGYWVKVNQSGKLILSTISSLVGKTHSEPNSELLRIPKKN